MRPVAQRFGEWASASRTFSVITDLVAIVQRGVDRLFALIFETMIMHACMFHLLLLRLLLTAATF